MRFDDMSLNKIYLLASLAAHLLIIVYGVFLIRYDQAHMNSSSKIVFIPSELVSAASLDAIKTNPNRLEPKSISSRSSVNKIHTQSLSPANRQNYIKRNLNKSQEGGFVQATAAEKEMLGKNLLLALLHKQIAEHQVYPEQAEEIDLSGTVTVSFQLLPDGKVEELHISHSSGSAILDNEALEAVRKISPVLQASHYLHTASNFSLDIIYE